jgi:hypothetical protein
MLLSVLDAKHDAPPGRNDYPVATVTRLVMLILTISNIISRGF